MKKYQSRVKQIYIPYYEWEDFISGMWRSEAKDKEDNLLQAAIEFTGNHEMYGNAMNEVILAWPKTMLNSLTNKNINKRAFLGQCACQYKINIPEYIVRAAWKQLTQMQRDNADVIAQKIIDKWTKRYEEENKTICKDMGRQMLFEWDSR